MADPVDAAVAPAGAPPAEERRTTSVAGQTILILGSRVVGALSTGVLTIVLARMLGLDGYGDYAFALTIATLAALFASLGIDSATSRWVAEGYNGGIGISRVILRGLRLRTVVAGTTFGLLAIIAGPLASAFGEPELENAVRAAALALFFSAGYQWVTGVYEGVQRGGLIAVMSLVKAVVEFVVVLALLMGGFGVVAAIFGNAIGYMATVAVGLWYMRPYLERRAGLPEVEASSATILRYGNHIWLAGVAWLLFERVDLVLLGVFIDTDAVGLYDAPWRVATILGLLGLSLASSVTPRIASADPATAGPLLSKALRVSLIFYLVIGAITAASADDLIAAALGAEFAESATVLQALLPYIVLIGLAPILSRALDFIGVASARKWIALAAFLGNLVLDLILLPTIGLYGAAIGTNVAIFGFVAGHYVLVKRHLPLQERALAATVARSTVAAVVGGAVCWVVLQAPGPGLLRLAVAVPLGIAAALATLLGSGELSADELRIPPRFRGTRALIRASWPEWRASLASPNAMLPLGTVAAALVVGGAVGASPLLAIGGLAGLAVMALLLSDITVGAVAFIIIQPLALVIGAGESLITKGAGVILLITWLVTLRYPSARRRYLSFTAHNPLLAFVAVAFMAWCVASILWSLNPGYTVEAIQRYALGILLLAIVFTAARNRRAAILLCGAYAISAVLSTLVGIATGNTPEGRLAGTLADANEFAAFCVPALLICAALAAYADTMLRRFLFAGGALVCALGIVLSGSRGGIVAIVAALAVWTIFGGRWRLRVLTASVVVGIVVVGYINVAAAPQTRERLSQIVQSDELASNGGTGRTDIWRVGWRAYSDHPTKGSGAGTYTEATPRYLAQPGLVRRGDFFTETPKVAHNMYLHVLVELGTVGMALFGVLLLICLVAATRAAHLFRLAGDLKLELLSRTVLAGTVGVLVADVFISGQYQRTLWILLGICVAMLGVARTAEARVRAPEATRGAPVISPWAPRPDRVPAAADSR
ncbi:oligosaccharide flippase family protein [Miltoncostaea marina]|uniref:oligosaccharide flippase family protein n=1 Tax=Miltoncostaea marina TaxID=2843215 RepID=UPI001C3C5EB7|nr:oligosaccharide flippase family protein [Miltoncostaea marina]